MKITKKIFKPIIYILFFSNLLSCTSTHPRHSNDTFLNGDTRLNCTFLCSGKFGINLEDLHQLYLKERWVELSQKVTQIGFNINIAYFYLGRAAEGLGKTKAAETYYLLSQSAPRCLLNGCQGLEFPDIANNRLASVRQQLLKPEHSSQLSNISTSPSSSIINSDSQKNITQQQKKCEIDSNCESNETCNFDENNNSECAKITEQKTFSSTSQKNKIYKNEIKLISIGGVYEIPVILNDVLKINVIVDSGAADVSIAPDVALTLIRTGTIKKTDWMPGKIYQFADGSKAKSERFNLRSITIGNKTFKNVTCSIMGSVESPMLLGQSVLRKLGSYTIDYKKEVFIFE